MGRSVYRFPSCRRAVVATGVLTALVAGLGAAFASFSATTTASAGLATATLSPASGLSATPACNGLLSAKATLTWTAATSPFASGYKIQRYNNGNADGAAATVTPATTTTLTQTGLATGTSYSWTLYAYYQTWTSATISANGTTPALCL